MKQSDSKSLELIKAVNNKDLAQVEKLIDDGANIFYADLSTPSALMIAATVIKSEEMVKLLLGKCSESFINLNRKDVEAVIKTATELWDKQGVQSGAQGIFPSKTNEAPALVNIIYHLKKSLPEHRDRPLEDKKSIPDANPGIKDFIDGKKPGYMSKFGGIISAVATRLNPANLCKTGEGRSQF